jgi:DNA-directed RNA polymerase subunit RPC12/RpoP
MLLVCTRRCGGSLFRALSAEVDIDSTGEYQAHRVVQPSYVCLNCGSPALDLAGVPAEIAAEEEADVAAPTRQVLCPVCETLVAVAPSMECPVCGSDLEGLETA